MATDPVRPPEGTWARPVRRLRVDSASSQEASLNVEGMRVAGALQGFGQLWQKTYRIRLVDMDLRGRPSPAGVMRTWRENFSSFWPKGNHFYAPITGIEPGEVALLNLSMPGGVRLSTGVMVIYADEESFSFMTPEGHVFAGWITFSAFSGGESTVVQVDVLIRPSDPLYDLGFRLFRHREDRFWEETLRNLAAYLGVACSVTSHSTCLDSRVQWAYAGNVWHNAAVRSLIYSLLAPLRRLTKAVRQA